MADIVLRTEALSKQYGALVAVDSVTLGVAEWSAHAVIGPNGAGKTTLINLLSGEVKPSHGRIRFRDHEIAGAPSDRIARLGIGRSYQKTNIFGSFSCIENCWIGAQSHLPSSMRFFRPAPRYRAVAERAERALALCGLLDRRDAMASAISYGEQRQLEIGMMLATEPTLLLLDEPLAGMSGEEAARVIDLLQRLAEDHTLVLIEHDLDAVFAIADTVTVMVNGAILETGPPDRIRTSEAVREAYIGDGETE